MKYVCLGCHAVADRYPLTKEDAEKAGCTCSQPQFAYTDQDEDFWKSK